MDRCALFVDAGYLLADGAMAVHGTRHREAVSWDYPGLLQLMTSLSRERTGLPLLRCYWYEATVEGRRTPEHDVLADIPGLKLRLSRIRPGRREGVDAQVHRDLMTLARNNAICDAVVVSGDEDLAQVVCDAQDLGIRVSVIHIAAEGGWAVSRSLRQECDDLVELGAAHLRPYVNLVAGVTEASNGHHQPLSNGHAAPSLPPAQSSVSSGQPGQGGQPSLPSSVQPSLPPVQPQTPASTGSHASASTGQSNGLPSGSAGVHGSSSGSAGVHGSSSGSAGVYGSSSGSAGVLGPSSGSAGVQGSSSGSAGGHGSSSGSAGGHGSAGVLGSSSGSASGHGSSSGSAGVHGAGSGSAGGHGASSSGRGQSSSATPPALPAYTYQPDSQPHVQPTSSAPISGPLQAQSPSPSTGQFSTPQSGSYQPGQLGPYTGPQPAPVNPPSAATAGATTLADAVKAAHREGHDFGESVARDAPALWLEAVLARKPRMPSDLEARLLQGSSLPIDFLLHDEVRHALRRGFWDALERARN